MTIKAFIAPSLFDPYTWNNFIPKNNFWEKTNTLDDADVIVYIDKSKKIETSKYKILYLLESEHLLQIKHIDLINYLKPDITITFNKNLVDNESIFYANCPIQSWIKKPDLYKKTKFCSFITSLKQMTPMQRYRVSIYEKYKTQVDCYGIGIFPIQDKLEGLKDYCFSFAIENDIVPGYFSEKILDCFMTGTVPIYVGHEYIKNVFDERGIIFYDDLFDINKLNQTLYDSMMPFIENNFNKAKLLNFSFDDYFLVGMNYYDNQRKSNRFNF
jgi:hypothetical protein